VRFPGTPEAAAEVARGFEKAREPYPRLTDVVGAIDGTFVFVRVGPDEKLPHCNYKWPRSAILLVIVVDSDRQILWYDCEHTGNASDQGVLLDDDVTDVPADDPADPVAGWINLLVKNGRFLQVPDGFVLLGDSGFAWKRHLVTVGDSKAVDRLYKVAREGHWANAVLQDELNLNSHLNGIISSHRTVVEQTFGELVGSWEILRRGKDNPDRSKLITEVCCILHNLRRRIRLEDSAAGPPDPSSGEPKRSRRRPPRPECEGDGFKALCSAQEYHGREMLRRRLKVAKRPRSEEHDDPEGGGAHRAKRTQPQDQD
jgi:hypothetical protein